MTLALRGFDDKEKIVNQSLSWRSPWWKIPQFKRRVTFQLAEIDLQPISGIQGFLMLRVHETIIKGPWTMNEMRMARERFAETEHAFRPITQRSSNETDGKVQN